jgi:hypothetical protein
MSKTKATVKLLPFDAARYLTDDAAVAGYMTAILETEDPAISFRIAETSFGRSWGRPRDQGGRRQAGDPKGNRNFQPANAGGSATKSPRFRGHNAVNACTNLADAR